MRRRAPRNESAKEPTNACRKSAIESVPWTPVSGTETNDATRAPSIEPAARAGAGEVEGGENGAGVGGGADGGDERGDPPDLARHRRERGDAVDEQGLLCRAGGGGGRRMGDGARRGAGFPEEDAEQGQ